MSHTAYAVGLDLSLTGSGIATIGLETGHVALSVVETAPDGDDLAAVLDRLAAALQGIASRVPAERALVVVEAPSHGSRHGKAHERAGLWWRTVAYLHHSGHLLAQAYPRTRAKYAAGHLPVKNSRKGPDKREIVAASKAEFPHLTLSNDNIADAFALARMGARHLGSPIDPTTRQRVESVAAVRWPDSTTEGTKK